MRKDLVKKIAVAMMSAVLIVSSSVNTWAREDTSDFIYNSISERTRIHSNYLDIETKEFDETLMSGYEFNSSMKDGLTQNNFYHTLNFENTDWYLNETGNDFQYVPLGKNSDGNDVYCIGERTVYLYEWMNNDYKKSDIFDVNGNLCSFDKDAALGKDNSYPFLWNYNTKYDAIKKHVGETYYIALGWTNPDNIEYEWMKDFWNDQHILSDDIGTLYKKTNGNRTCLGDVNPFLYNLALFNPTVYENLISSDKFTGITGSELAKRLYVKVTIEDPEIYDLVFGKKIDGLAYNFIDLKGWKNIGISGFCYSYIPEEYEGKTVKPLGIMR